jgi:hypothetical protein
MGTSDTHSPCPRCGNGREHETEHGRVRTAPPFADAGYTKRGYPVSQVPPICERPPYLGAPPYLLLRVG